MKSALAALASVLLGIAVGLLAMMLMPGGNHDRLGEVLLMAGFVAVPLLLGGFVYRRWFFASASSCLVGLAGYALIALLLAMRIPDSFTSEVFALLLVFTLSPWFAGFLAGKHLWPRTPAAG